MEDDIEMINLDDNYGEGEENVMEISPMKFDNYSMDENEIYEDWLMMMLEKKLEIKLFWKTICMR